jgi:hypothetical protein
MGSTSTKQLAPKQPALISIYCAASGEHSDMIYEIGEGDYKHQLAMETDTQFVFRRTCGKSTEEVFVNKNQLISWVAKYV